MTDYILINGQTRQLLCDGCGVVGTLPDDPKDFRGAGLAMAKFIQDHAQCKSKFPAKTKAPFKSVTDPKHLKAIKLLIKKAKR